MVHALVNISKESNHVLNIVKAKYGLKDKSQAIEVMASEYEKKILQPTFKPEFVKSVQKARAGPFRKVNSLDELLK